MNIGKSIIAIRFENELSQTELAKKCGISNSYLSEIENDKKTPDLILLKKICDALDVPMHVFVFKAINESQITDPRKKRLVREIKPLLSKIADELYQLQKNLPHRTDGK